MPTRTIVVTVDVAAAEIVVDRMWQWGVHAVAEEMAGDGRTKITTSVGNDPTAIERAIARLDPTWSWELIDVDDAVATVSPEFLAPTWYAPSMVTVPAALLPFDDPGAELVTIVDPGSAFGLGDHPTTRTSMALLATLLRGDSIDATRVRLLDVGCGTGALAILAAQLGVRAVRAIDIADAAVEATHHNATLNRVGGSVDVDTASLATLTDRYDVIVANILAPVLISMAGDFRRLLRPGGSLLVSGLLEDRHQHVLDALAPLEPVASLADDGWISFVLR